MTQNYSLYSLHKSRSARYLRLQNVHFVHYGSGLWSTGLHDLVCKIYAMMFTSRILGCFRRVISRRDDVFFIENFDSVVSSDSGVYATPFPPMNPFRMYFWYIFVCVFSGVFFFFFLQHFFFRCFSVFLVQSFG